jgi:hypothetical protein
VPFSLNDSLAVLEQREPREPPTDIQGTVTVVTGANNVRIHLHSPDGEMTRAARHILDARREWLDVPGTERQVRDLCVLVLKSLGLTSAAQEALSTETVQLTFTPNHGPEVTEFPWEFALAEATRARRHRLSLQTRQRFLVYRHLDATPQQIGDPSSLLVIESAPSQLFDQYGFDSKRRLIESALEFEVDEPLRNPTLREIGDAVKAAAPGIIHVMGIDARRGRTLGAESVTEDIEGVYLTDASGELQPEAYRQLAAELAKGGGAPFVALNLYNSSTGALDAIRAGATSAIGFQGEIDDLCAEQFFARFYNEWKRCAWDLLPAFRNAWRALEPYADRIRGTGVVLWTRTQPLTTRTPGTRRESTSRPTAPSVQPAVGTAAGTGAAAAFTTPSATPPPTPVPAPTPTPIQASPLFVTSEGIEVEYVEPTTLNYSLLHNNENFIPKLVVRRQKPGNYGPISVQIVVSAGPQEAVYRKTFTLNDTHSADDVAETARIPLTSELTRTLDESLATTVYLLVKWGELVLKECTTAVTLKPIDEWCFDDERAKWLPSFVFPRDPSVRKVIGNAQRYLTAMRDDAGAGFDGYQSFEPNGATLAEQSRCIDAQVQAIWWALVNEYGLGYINPPPNYTDMAQRLRTPSEIIDGGRGTCIDLALLLTACLEYIEIYPVVFMLNDHAFPGYWRCEASYKEFGRLALSTSGITGDTAAESVTIRDAHPESWMIGRTQFSRIAALVNQGHLVPLETVNLTSRGGFWPSVSDGIANLRSKRQFYALYDLRTARQGKKKVTPLPIWSRRL